MVILLKICETVCPAYEVVALGARYKHWLAQLMKKKYQVLHGGLAEHPFPSVAQTMH